MYKSILSMLLSLGLMACFPDPPTGGGGGGPPADPCDLITVEGGAYAGYPFDVNAFTANVLPKLEMSCQFTNGCHGLGSPASRLQVFSTANAGNNCFENETFNQVVKRSSYTTGGAGSAIVLKSNDPADMHPDNTEIAGLLQTFVDNAKATAEGGGPGPGVDGGPGSDGGGGGGGGSLDPNVYATQIHPILTGSNCTNSNCHNINDGALGGGFGLQPRALAGSANVTQNIAAIAERIDTSLPAAQANMTEFYLKCTDSHLGSVVSNPQAIEDWIAASLTAAAIQ